MYMMYRLKCYAICASTTQMYIDDVLKYLLCFSPSPSVTDCPQALWWLCH